MVVRGGEERPPDEGQRPEDGLAMVVRGGEERFGRSSCADRRDQLTRVLKSDTMGL
jgi:hypothetical protein